MSFSHHISSRVIRRVALGLTVAAVAVPSAAASQPDASLSTRTAADTIVLPAVEVNKDGYLTATSPPITVVLPSVEVNSDGFLTARPTFEPNFPIPSVNWHAQSQGAPEFPSAQIRWSHPEAATPVNPVSVRGFDYGDAAIGAAIALGAALLATLCALVLRRSRRSATLA
jgi:hypothetical protein